MKCIMSHLGGIDVVIGGESGLVVMLTSLHRKKYLGFQAGKWTSTIVWHLFWKLMKAKLKASNRICFLMQHAMILGSPHHGCYGTKILGGLKGRFENMAVNSKPSVAMSLAPFYPPVNLTLITRRAMKNRTRNLDKWCQKKISGFGSYMQNPWNFTHFHRCYPNVISFIFRVIVQTFFNMALYSQSSHKNCWLTSPEVSFN